MGMMGRIFGGGGIAAAGQAVTGVAEVFTRNATRRMELDEEAYARAIAQHGTEFILPATWFDSLVNGLNRLPRPLLALGTLGLFAYAMVEPVGFGARMQGLQQVPEPLWWLLGAIVGFYFGAREAHYFRMKLRPSEAEPQPDAPISAEPAAPTGDFSDNAALRDWAAAR